VPNVYAPCTLGHVPVKSDARVGVQVGFGQYARSNRTPRAASRSRFGVRICGLTLPSVR